MPSSPEQISEGVCTGILGITIVLCSREATRRTMAKPPPVHTQRAKRLRMNMGRN